MRSSCWFVIILLSIHLYANDGSNDNYCPSKNWTPCAPANSPCKIPPNLNQTTISYGGYNPNQEYSSDGQWVFAAISNTRGNVFQVDCTGTNFGKIYPGKNGKNPPNGCCYIANTADSYVNFEGPSVNEYNWKKLAKKGDKFIVNPIQYVRYGAADELGGIYIYRWMEGEFTCQPSWFGNIGLFKNAKPKCSIVVGGINNKSYTDFISCGNSQINECNLDVTGSSHTTGSISLVQYGEYPNFAHRFAYSNNNHDQIPCNANLFGNPNPNGGTQFCAVSNSTIFTGAIGQWEVAESCAGHACVIDTDVEWGVTSTNTKSKTTTWQHSVSQTVSSGFSFCGFSFKYSLTTETSESVSKEVSESYSQSLSKTCGVKCGNGSAEDWTVYQWQFEMGEFIGVDLNPFDIYACYYVCSTSSIPPQCPPTYCKPNTDCTQCQGWSPPNSTFISR